MMPLLFKMVDQYMLPISKAIILHVTMYIFTCIFVDIWVHLFVYVYGCLLFAKLRLRFMSLTDKKKVLYNCCYIGDDIHIYVF